MINNSRTREKIEGRISRRRTYNCINCSEHYQVDIREPLPKEERICPTCKSQPAYTFTLRPSGDKITVHANDAEHATLRAWLINPKAEFVG